MIILIGGEKGGTGKTTLATNLSAMRLKRGGDVLLVDTDKQGSASNWSATRDEGGGNTHIPSIQKFGKSIIPDLQELARRYGDIVIDAGGRDNLELRASMTLAQRIYIPVQASQYDVWTLEQMDNLVSQAQAMNPSLQAFVVINRASTNPSVKEAKEVEKILEDYDCLSFSGVVIRDRIAYRKTASEGLSIEELKPLDSKAKAEVDTLYSHVFGQH